MTEVEQPVYQYYRLITDTANGLRSIGEIRYFGFEVIEDDNDTYQCEIELVEHTTNDDGEAVSTVTDLGEVVSYEVDSTPVVDDISPRWGAVSGGTPITFTGRNFNSVDVSDYSIVIDDVDCPVTDV